MAPQPLNPHRKQIEMLRKTVAWYEEIFRTIEEVYFEADLNGTFTFCNNRVKEHLGYEPEEMIGKKSRDFMTPEESQRVYEAYRHLYRTGEPIKGMDQEYICKDGRRAIRQVSSTLIKDSDGNTIGFRGISRDVTEQKQMEERLRQSEERYRTIVEGINDGYYEVDLNGKFTFFNQRLCDYYGYPAEELMEMVIEDYVDPPEAEKLRTAFTGMFYSGRSINSIDMAVNQKSGEKKFYQTSAALVRDKSGKKIGFRGIVRDITDIKEAEKALKEAMEAAETANRTKSHFLANMSHEIRTPMNGIIGMTELLLSTDLDQEQTEYAETVRTSARFLLQIINDVLDFSKMEAGRMELETIDFDLRNSMEDLSDLVGLKVAQKGLEFGFAIDPEVPALLKGDPGRLRQILLNLTGNAIKFTHKGEISIHIDLEKESTNTARIRFSVSDTGIGIDPDKFDQLFESFSQVDSSTTRKFGGTGLGLAISKQLVELMDGRIGIESTPDKGSTFWFTAEFEKQARAKEDLPTFPASIRGRKILVVDDNATNRQLICCYLKSWECRHRAAASGSEALHLLYQAVENKAPFHMVLSDHMMPGMDGEALGRAIKADPVLKPTLLVMLTSIGQRGDAIRMKEAGFDAYLTKPIKRSQLHSVILQVFNRNDFVNRVEAKPGLVTRYSAEEQQKQSFRILVAEDNPVNRMLALRLLEKFGYRAEAVTNGREALEALVQRAYHLVLMDVQMPVMDGLEATRNIRKTESETGDGRIPIIATTAHAMAGDRKVCIEAGMDDYVSKPLDPNQLLETVERYLLAGQYDDFKTKALKSRAENA